MSTKNLARTIIEGGRHTYNKWDRRYSHAEVRANEKAYISEVKEDIENYYDYDIEPLRPVGKGFADKLGPIYRWLAGQVGRPWDEVRSDVSKTFDTRTTAGRHIVYDHMLTSVQIGPEFPRYYSSPPDDPTTSYSDNDFYVDDDGILQKKRYLGRRGRRDKVPSFNTNQIANWLSGRVVGMVGKKLFWFIPTGKSKKHKGFSGNYQWACQWGGARPYYAYNYGLRYLYLYHEPIYKYDEENKIAVDDKGKRIILDYKSTWRDGSPNFRQDRKLNDKELAFWNTIPEHYQVKVLQRSPTYPDPPKPDYRGYYY